MGEIADMMLDGILDASGEYTGHDYGYPVCPKGWFTNGENERKVNYFLKQRKVYDFEKRRILVSEYGDTMSPRRTKFMKICAAICEDRASWLLFKIWVDNKVGFKKGGAK